MAKDKKKVREFAAGLALKILSDVYVYASVRENNKLKDRVSYSESDMKYCRDSVFIDILNVIPAAAKQNISELELYGVVQADIDELETLTGEIATANEDPRQAITNRV